MDKQHIKLLSKTSRAHVEEGGHFEELLEVTSTDCRTYHPIHCKQGLIDLGPAENALCDDLLLPVLNQNLPKISVEHIRYTNFSSSVGETGITTLITKFLQDEFSSNISESNLILTSGVGSANEIISFAIADKGDAFLVLAPYYYNFNDDAGLKPNVSLIPVYHDGTEKMSECFNKALEKARQDGINVRAVCIFNPNNPTGKVVGKDHILDLIDWCQENELHLIVDEAYNLTVYEDKESFQSVFSLVKPDNPYVHITWGLSKNFSVPGFRLGVLCSFNTAVLKLASRMAVYNSVPLYIRNICSSLFIDRVQCKKIIKESNERLKKAKDYFTKRLADIGVAVCKDTISGFYVWADFSKYMPEKTIEAEKNIYKRLLKFGVCITPGYMYSNLDYGFFRVIYAFPQPTIDLALERIILALNPTEQPRILESLTSDIDDEIEFAVETCTLEDDVKNLFSALRSDKQWVKENTGEKWAKENPAAAKIFEKK
ncbi:DgyrCDS5156 [Dimorphilus gyrociliatus]|uniref:DgyrCDS5156 n=1 Tax=Dimorphilus gyrociliatus TaxID=2664684 RepID=A0A7I8VNS6_9ANNE|nr:DgyrCDS5156 [Dimorphilus gyrociliatus]